MRQVHSRQQKCWKGVSITHCQMFSVREVHIGQPLAAKAKGRQAMCGVGKTSAFILSWGLRRCTKGSTGNGTPLGARPGPAETRIGRRSCSQPLAA